MFLNNLLYYEDKYSIRVNEENDSIFYYFDYDSRSADINMEFQHFHPFYELCIPLCPNAIHFIEGIPYEILWGSLRPNCTRRNIRPAALASG